jgi:APA family basic amino acid/polyamine antiporter
MAEHASSFKPSLSLVDATMVVAGSMIGSGIFIVTSDIAKDVGSAGWIIAVWLITGFMTIVAALSYGELSGMYPKAGGQYVYLREAFNPLAGFLYGWSFFAVIQTATIAAVAVAFSRFTAYLIPEVGEDVILLTIGTFKISAAQILAIFLIIFLTYTNSRGIKGGKIIQTIFTSVKLFSLFGLIILGFLIVKHSFWSENLATGMKAVHFNKNPTGTAADDGTWLPISGIALIGAIASAMSGSIFSSDSWNNVTFIAGEIKNPKRNIGLSLFLGTLIVTIIYVAANLMYLNVLPLHDIAFAPSRRLAVISAESIFGPNGAYVIAVMIMISTFGCNNGLILAGARVYYTMAKDGLFFRKTGTLNKNAVPEFALWIQCAMAGILCLSGSYGDLLDMIAFVAVLFYAVTILGIFILRKRRPDAERPYKAFGYPVLPIIYIILALTFCIFLIQMKPVYAGIGFGIVLAGVPLYYLAVRTKKVA